MHKARFARILTISLVVVCVVGLHGAMAQTRRPARKQDGDRSENLRINEITQSAQVRAPEYNIRNVDTARKARAPDWGRVRVVYDSKPEWMHALSCRYYVLMLTNAKDAETPYSLIEGDVSYTDVRQGTDHMSEMFLHPRTIEKLGDIVAVAVEISYGAETVKKSEVSNKSQLEPRLAAGEWWKSDEIRKSEKVTLRAGLLLNRMETPFAYVNYWDYETIRR